MRARAAYLRKQAVAERKWYVVVRKRIYSSWASTTHIKTDSTDFVVLLRIAVSATARGVTPARCRFTHCAPYIL